MFELASDFDSARSATSFQRLASSMNEVPRQSGGRVHHARFSGQRRIPSITDWPPLNLPRPMLIYVRYAVLTDVFGCASAGDQNWSANQFKAAQESAKLVAKALVAEAQQDERDVKNCKRCHSPSAARLPTRRCLLKDSRPRG